MTSAQVRSKPKNGPAPAFIISKDKIPDRDAMIRPDKSRSFLSKLPERYEHAKLRNMATRSLRKAANESKLIFEGAS